MTAYPTVNWWSGNLRPYESRLSLLTRFRELNGLSSHRCLSFLQLSLDSDSSAQQEAAVRLSEILHEGLPDIQALFSPTVVFADCGYYSPPPARRDRHLVRYCEGCARHGYHSYLHELNWLCRCPFHMCELKDTWVRMHSSSIADGLMIALKSMMQAQCKKWPHCDDSFPPDDAEHLSVLTDWVKRASLIASRMSQREVWRSGEDDFLGNVSLAQALGQLRAMAPMPEGIAPLVAEAGDRWSRQSCQFSRQTRIKIEDLRLQGLGFGRVLDFYKCIGVFSSPPRSFVTRALHAQDCLRKRHGACRCEWELIREGWAPNWVKVQTDERKHWSFRCPFEVAVAELDLCWAYQNAAHVGRNPGRRRENFVELAHDMHAAGLIQYARGAEMSVRGYLDPEQEIASCCEWVDDSQLSELLEKAAGWEVDAAYSAVSKWLDDIEDGLGPRQRDDPKYCIRLCEIENGLSLVRWVKN